MEWHVAFAATAGEGGEGPASQNITFVLFALRQVFAGLLDPAGGSPSVKILKAVELERQKENEPGGASEGDPQQPEEARARGQIVPLELDPTREDSLRACLDAVRARLPAGEDGEVHLFVWLLSPRSVCFSIVTWNSLAPAGVATNTVTTPGFSNLLSILAVTRGQLRENGGNNSEGRELGFKAWISQRGSRFYWELFQQGMFDVISDYFSI